MTSPHIASSTVTQSNSTPPTRLAFVDGLRGFAILLVLCRHYYVELYTPTLPRWADGLSLGYLGVHLFLVVSGFCIAWPYVGATPRPFAFRNFWQRRASRILPAYYVALALALVLALPMSPAAFWWQTITHLTMTHNFFATTVLALNGPFWSLALECQLYLLFPLFLAGFRRFGIFTTLFVVGIIQLMARVLIAARFGTEYSDLTFVLPWSVVGRMLEFALGMWVATVLKVGNRTLATAWWRSLLPLLTLCFAAAAIIAKRQLGVTAPLTDLFWSCSFLTLFFGASVPHTWLNQLFSWPPLVGLGVISYSVYLVHEFLLGRITDAIRHLQVEPLAILAGLVPAILLTIFCCCGFYYLVERPAQWYFTTHRSQRNAGIGNQLLIEKSLNK
ncbi:MAG: acyltransferase [Caldilineaceae bacterium]